MRLSLLPAEHLATDDGPALDESVHLVGRLARAGCRTCDDRGEALLAGVEHILAERARWLERAFPCPADDPASGEQRVSLGRGFLKQIHDQRAHTARVRRVLDKARLQHGEMVPHGLIREQAPVHCTKCDRIGGTPVALEKEVRITQQLRVGRLDACLRPRRGVVHAECLILRNGAPAEDLEQGSTLVSEALPALAQTFGEKPRHGSAELRWIIHHGIHKHPRIAASLSFAQQLDFVGEQTRVLEAPFVAEC